MWGPESLRFIFLSLLLFVFNVLRLNLFIFETKHTCFAHIARRTTQCFLFNIFALMHDRILINKIQLKLTDASANCKHTHTQCTHRRFGIVNSHTGSDATLLLFPCWYVHERIPPYMRLPHTHRAQLTLDELIINIVCEILLLGSTVDRDGIFANGGQAPRATVEWITWIVFSSFSSLGFHYDYPSTQRAASSGFVRIFIVHLCLCSPILPSPSSQPEVRVNEQT